MMHTIPSTPAAKVREGMDIYRYGGVESLVRSSSRFLRRQLLEPWHVSGEGIDAACSGWIPVQSPTVKTVSYAGRFRDRLPRRLAAIEGEVRTPERAIMEFADASVLGRAMILRVDGGYIVPAEVGSARNHSPRLAEEVSLVDLARGYFGRRRAERELDAAFLLTGKRGLPFAHWFYETLPKLRWYERYCRVVGRRPPLLVPSGLTDWQRDSLGLVGYSPDSLVEHGETTTNVRRLAVPPHPYRNRGYGFPGSPGNLRWVRNRILSNLPDGGRSFADRVYVSRADADRRRVRNEDELVTTLAEFGFRRYVVSELSFAEQVRLFAGASVVAGPHGAGLTNMIYASDADVIELLTEEGASEHFFVLANELDHSYEFVPCDPASDDDSPPRHRDMVVEPAVVRDVVAEI